MIKNLGQSPRCTKIFSIIFFTAVCNFLFISCNNSEYIKKTKDLNIKSPQEIYSEAYVLFNNEN